MRIILALALAAAAFCATATAAANEPLDDPCAEMPRNLLTVSGIYERPALGFSDPLGFTLDYRRRFCLTLVRQRAPLATEWTIASVGYTHEDRDSGELVTLFLGMRVGTAIRPNTWLELHSGLGPQGYMFFYYPNKLDNRFNLYTMKSWGMRYELGARLNYRQVFAGIGYTAHWPIGGEPGPVEFLLKFHLPDDIRDINRDNADDLVSSNFDHVERHRGRLHHQATFVLGFYW